MTLETLPQTLTYVTAVLLMNFVLVGYQRWVAVGLPGMLTVVLLLIVVGVLRSSAEKERQRRLSAEAEQQDAAALTRSQILFLANVSHELRTPLSSILGFSDLLTKSPQLDDDSRDMLHRVYKNAIRLNEMVEQILVLTQEDLARPNGRKVNVLLSDFVAELIAKLDPRLRANNLKVTIEDHIQRPVLADTLELERLINPILDNAAKFSQNGKLSIVLNAQPATRSGHLVIQILVKDEGIGISTLDWETCFAPFTQLHMEYNRTYGGAGMGLTIARKIARSLQGDVKIAASDIKRGTTVAIQVELGSGELLS